MTTVIKCFIFKAFAKLLFFYLIRYSSSIFPTMLSIMVVFLYYYRSITISWLIQINTFQEGECKNNGCHSPITICSCTFRTNKLASCLIKSSVNTNVNKHISKVSIIISLLTKIHIENAKKKRLTIKKTKFLKNACKAR